MHNPTKEQAIEAVEILDTLESDFRVAVMVFGDYENKFRRNEISKRDWIDVRRMTFSHLILNIWKLGEFSKKYSTLLNREQKNLLEPVKRRIKNEGIDKMRNAFVAHVPGKKGDDPRTNSDLVQLFGEISRKNQQEFLR